MRQALNLGMVAAAAATSILSLPGSSAFAASGADGQAAGSPAFCRATRSRPPGRPGERVRQHGRRRRRTQSDVRQLLCERRGFACSPFVHSRRLRPGRRMVRPTGPGTTDTAVVTTCTGAVPTPGVAHSIHRASCRATPCRLRWTLPSTCAGTPGTWSVRSTRPWAATVPPEWRPPRRSPRCLRPPSVPSSPRPRSSRRMVQRLTPPHVKVPAQHTHVTGGRTELAQTGADQDLLAAAAASAGLLIGGGILYRRGRAAAR